MQEENEEKSVSQFIINLCKGKTKVELEEAENNFRSYLDVVKQIVGRLHREGKRIRYFDEMNIKE